MIWCGIENVYNTPTGVSFLSIDLVCFRRVLTISSKNRWTVKTHSARVYLGFSCCRTYLSQTKRCMRSAALKLSGSQNTKSEILRNIYMLTDCSSTGPLKVRFERILTASCFPSRFGRKSQKQYSKRLYEILQRVSGKRLFGLKLYSLHNKLLTLAKSELARI